MKQSNSTIGPPAEPAEALVLASSLGGWAERGHGALSRRLAHAIRASIESGLLADGSRFPPERALASALAVSRSTLTSALDELRADGLVESRQGSATTVRGPAARAVTGSRVGDHFSGWAGIDLAVGNPPDAAHLPPISLDVADLLAAGEGPGVQPLGLMSLRSALAEMYTADGRLTDPEQIHVTAGAHHAVSLLVRTLMGPDRCVAADDPSYPGLYDIIEAIGARTIAVASDHVGLLPESLDRVLSEDRPGVVYVQTGPHNPTGRVAPVSRLRALADVLDRHGATVIEDCGLAELAFDGRPRPELADLCRRAVVVSVGSMSKVAWGGLRIGWFRAPAPTVDRSMYVRLGDDLGPSVPSQLLVLQLLPHLAEMGRLRRTSLRESVERSVAWIAAELPDWQLVAPSGGSVLWPELPITDTGPFVQLASRHGVRVAPGSVATAGRVADPHVRICVDRQWDVVETGLSRLALAWREWSTRGARTLG